MMIHNDTGKKGSPPGRVMWQKVRYENKHIFKQQKAISYQRATKHRNVHFTFANWPSTAE